MSFHTPFASPFDGHDNKDICQDFAGEGSRNTLPHSLAPFLQLPPFLPLSLSVQQRDNYAIYYLLIMRSGRGGGWGRRGATCI